MALLHFFKSKPKKTIESSRENASGSESKKTKFVEDIVEDLRLKPPTNEICYVVLFGNRPLTAKEQEDEDDIMCFTHKSKAEDFIQGYQQYYNTTEPLSILAIGQLSKLWEMLHNNAKDKLYQPPYGLLINYNYSGQPCNWYSLTDLKNFGFEGFKKGFSLYLR
ncbi:MAG: hypothetical protein KAT48_02985 [Bacteroidales bacterium]|nr:hypothetical protein [Bacteroidales bacterium]